MGIRGRLLILVLGISVPMALVGLFNLNAAWQTSRVQLKDSIKRQAELAAVAYGRWADAQQQPLTTLAIIADEQSLRSALLSGNMRYPVKTRPFWTDLYIVDKNGKVLVSYPKENEPPHSALIQHLLSEVKSSNNWVVVTDRTKDESRPVFAFATPIADGGAVIARIDGEAVSEIFNDIQLQEGSVISVFDAEGNRLYRKPTTESFIDLQVNSAPFFNALGNERLAVTEVESPYDGVQRVYGMARVSETNDVAIIGIPSETLYAPARKQLTRQILFSLIALLVTIIAALVVARSILSPISSLRSVAQEFGKGNRAVRADVKSAGEIAELSKTFNTMAEQINEREDRLQELDRMKSEFVSSVSHELRTPLTTIKTLAHVLDKNGLSKEEEHSYLKTISSECDRQIDLVSNLLDLSRIESGKYALARTEVNLNEILRQCFDTEKHVAEARYHLLELEVEKHLPFVMADSKALRRVICGLIENAIKYTPEEGRILISARKVENQVAISVADNGCGILPEDLPYIFDKFYRGRPFASNTNEECHTPKNDAPGVGLGLYLARNIVEQLGGRIEAYNNPTGGAVFTIYLTASEDNLNQI